MLKSLTIPLWAVALCLVMVIHTTTHQVRAAELTYDTTVQVSDNESVFNLSVFPGKAGYDNGTVSGIFGDGTVVDYRFFNADADTVRSWIDGGEGRVADITSPPAGNVAGPVNNSQNWPDVWVTSDPDTDPADFTTDTQAGAQNITGTIDISGLGTGSLYFIHGTYHDSFVLSLTMSGSGQPDIQTEFADDPPNTVNMGWVTSFTFSTGGVYNTISYSYTNTDADGSRARFMGAIVDGGDASKAQDPSPKSEALDVSRDVDLTWLSGQFAATHNLYMGETIEDVDTATVPAAADLTTASFDPGRLDFGQTYYWRVDEVNGTPDKTVFPGELWSFTVEPVAIPITTVTATASGANPDMGPEKTIDGSGLNELDHHSSIPLDMWLTLTDGSWIQYEFDKAYKLYGMQIWNSNQVIEPFIGFGVKDAVVETSLDGVTWTVVEGVGPFAQGTGQATYEANTTVDLSGMVAKYVKISPQNAHGTTGQSGLSEVRFSRIPTDSRDLLPADGSTTASVDVTLSWRSGREAASHAVYLGTDPAALALMATAEESTVATDPLDYAQTYYWQVIEVNEAETPSQYASAILSFTTPVYGTVDDFESYSGDEGEEVFMTWFDGFGGDASLGGSATGHFDGPFVETANTYPDAGGSQSMPLYIDNDGDFFDIDGKVSSPAFSEAVRDLDGQDWTASGIKTLSIMFSGTAGLTGQLYCKINGTKVTYDGAASNLGLAAWQAWNIDLSTVGANLTNVRELALGVEGGTSGILYIDAIRLYTQPGERIVPEDPGANGLVGAWSFDEGSGAAAGDSSGNARNGTVVDAIWNTGIQASALSFNGTSSYVNIDGFKGIVAVDGVQQAFTISNWIKTVSDGEMVTWGLQGAATRLSWRVESGILRTEHAAGNLRSDTPVNDDEWHHVALVVTEGASLQVPATQFYLDGLPDTTNSGTNTPYNITPDSDVRIGMSGPQGGRFFTGLIDEVQIYDRALTDAELLWLAGRTEAIDKPF